MNKYDEAVKSWALKQLADSLGLVVEDFYPDSVITRISAEQGKSSPKAILRIAATLKDKKYAAANGMKFSSVTGNFDIDNETLSNLVIEVLG